MARSDQSALHSVSLPEGWTPSSWRARPALQLPTYPDPDVLAGVQEELRALPPLVTSWEIMALKQQLADAQEGRRFLLQGGDCAENFSDCNSDVISNRLKVLLQMSLVLVHGLRLPVVRVGRFAGQYAKPRSADTETRDGVTLPSYRGDIVNSPGFTAQARTPDPRRMVKAHARSAMTMNFVRSLIDGGFADLHHPEYWDLRWVGHSPLADEYHRMVSGIGDAVRFMETLSGTSVNNLNRVDFFTSHEALLLPYEEAQTRQVPRQWGWFDLSTHFPWIGMRTAAIDGAHVEYFRGIRNPVAVKVGPSVTPDQLLALVDVLNPDDEPGRLSLIHRMGAAHVADKLPPLLDALKRNGRRVLWICDPMHGNTEATSNGYKTRRFRNIRSEIEQSFDIHAAAGTRLGGVHLELTGEDVTECTGGARDLSDLDLERAYRSSVDPRLNYEQALETAMLIVRKQAQLAAPASA
ncbi:class II 3-deoxy-7-phosphoheptulonate synthase [Luteimonas mephitis]|uniref:class II 3-deoxy-7-phosphoheptulonate synthase n=1 Tax=Luteimonas mephitis TaxID=83615 RepID=UPI00040E4666|nr:3-deoxy-7-phosphoheptulonate synthase class II [Luteimonas mephitis]